MKFRKYMHVERYGNDEVEGIEDGEVYVFPKLDGSNVSIRRHYGKVRAASRNRDIGTGKDDHLGFNEWLHREEKMGIFRPFFIDYPHLILYGEWLVPHTLKDYRDGAWKKFYVFDVFDNKDGKYMHFEDYSPLMENYEIDYIPPLAIVKDGSYEKFCEFLSVNDYLMQDGKVGEGIVLKNYNFLSRYKHFVYAKIVRSEFKDRHRKETSAPKIKMFPTEKKIVDRYLTKALVEKEFSKLASNFTVLDGEIVAISASPTGEGWSNKRIPELFGRITHTFITEELWNILKKEKNPIIDFKRLNGLIIRRIKELMPELF
jgi:hypothetical protein